MLFWLCASALIPAHFIVKTIHFAYTRAMAKQQNIVKRIVQKIAHDNEVGARKGVLEDLFNDFNANRAQVYKFNFIRGIFFGLGSVLGGTVLIAGAIWLLNLTGQFIPGIAGFVDEIVRIVQARH